MFDTVMHWLGFGLCHQLPARSFFAGGHQLPVCARDTGIYVGFIVSLALIALLERGRRRTGMPPAWVLAVGAAFVFALAWDGVTSYAGFRETTNLIRLATGVATGFALPLAVVPMLNVQLWERRGEGRVLGEPLSGALWCLAVPVTIAFVWWGGPMLQTGYAVAVALAVLATFTSINLIMVSLVPAFEQRFTRLRDAWPAIVIALAVTIVELAAADGVRLALLRMASRL